MSILSVSGVTCSKKHQLGDHDIPTQSPYIQMWSLPTFIGDCEKAPLVKKLLRTVIPAPSFLQVHKTPGVVIDSEFPLGAGLRKLRTPPPPGSPPRYL
ncbi:hypothetical protein GX50_01726 [[Emmonsia] crescens]|uniref:Uncharacterized protein n=1 Tax=[Emmonsia] crescens TaxID=73230 RepID=A0A2B7ZQC3_9EURO|nr:hypothetical protein GX50_01726 [Emmonsia crescens]